MKRTALFAVILMASAAPAFAQVMSEPTVRVGGHAMFPSKTIVANAVNSADHTTLVAAVKAAGLVDTLNGPGPFTVFAPTNAAFAMLPAGTVDNLVKPENKAMLTKILTYHVVARNYDSNKLRSLILEGNGTATLNTVSGGKLWLMMNGSTNLAVKDEKGDIADITIADVRQSNGVIQVVDTCCIRAPDRPVRAAVPRPPAHITRIHPLVVFVTRRTHGDGGQPDLVLGHPKTRGLCRGRARYAARRTRRSWGEIPVRVHHRVRQACQSGADRTQPVRARAVRVGRHQHLAGLDAGRLPRLARTARAAQGVHHLAQFVVGRDAVGDGLGLLVHRLRAGPGRLVRSVGQVEIVFTLLFSRFYLKETLRPCDIAGLALVVGGVLLIVMVS